MKCRYTLATFSYSMRLLPLVLPSKDKHSLQGCLPLGNWTLNGFFFCLIQTKHPNRHSDLNLLTYNWTYQSFSSHSQPCYDLIIIFYTATHVHTSAAHRHTLCAILNSHTGSVMIWQALHALNPLIVHYLTQSQWSTLCSRARLKCLKKMPDSPQTH